MSLAAEFANDLLVEVSPGLLPVTDPVDRSPEMGTEWTAATVPGIVVRAVTVGVSGRVARQR
ncbi:hypothetical protein [Streptomyces sp. URMC 123]|uniref:hypothetical protein n=1 Tax=Streptomyces sp. URMC 123 TaxID=3423403 RepID=UPI003F1D195F